MSKERYSAMRIGEHTERTIEVTERHFAAAPELFDDHHPIHVDDRYARARGLPGRILPGAVISGIASSALAAMLSGSGLALLEYAVRYRAPVYLGDRLTTRCTIVGKEDKPARNAGIVFLEITAHNQHGELVAEGSAVDLVSDAQADI